MRLCSQPISGDASGFGVLVLPAIMIYTVHVGQEAS